MFSKYPNQESISDIHKKFRLKVRQLSISQKLIISLKN